jgi:hypothetical protein
MMDVITAMEREAHVKTEENSFFKMTVLPVILISSNLADFTIFSEVEASVK